MSSDTTWWTLCDQCQHMKPVKSERYMCWCKGRRRTKVAVCSKDDPRRKCHDFRPREEA